MAARTIKISLEPDLLDQIDADRETREKGRSAFIRSAVRFYLKTKERQEIERQLAQAYAGEADSLLKGRLEDGENWKPTRDWRHPTGRLHFFGGSESGKRANGK